MIVIAILALALAIVALGYAVKAYKKKRELVYEIEVEKKDTPQNENVSVFEQDPRKEFNKRVWALRDCGDSQQTIANLLGVSRTTIRRELKKGRLYE